MNVRLAYPLKHLIHFSLFNPQRTREWAWEEKLDKATWHTHHSDEAGMAALENIIYSWQAQGRKKGITRFAVNCELEDMKQPSLHS